MTRKSKKSRAAGRFGSRYGKKVRDKIVKIEDKQRIKQICPYCKRPGVKRISKGIWYCKKCNRKFASDVYFLNQNDNLQML